MTVTAVPIWRLRLARAFPRYAARALLLIIFAVLVLTLVSPSTARSAVASAAAARPATPLAATRSSLESAAARADSTGRAVAMSLIGLAFAVTATVLAFRRDFKEAIGVFAVGVVAVLFATAAGVSLLRDTVTTLFGAH